MRIGRFSGALPLVLMTVLIVAVGAFATVRQDAFLTSFNLNNLLLLTMPLALVSLGQTCALLVGGFDVSVAALMTFCVVVASYTMTFDTVGLGVASRGPGDRRGGLGDRDLQRRARSASSSFRRSSRRSGRSASSRARRSSSGITPRARSRATSSAVSRGASASFRSPSSPSWSSPSSATCGCIARARASRSRAVGLDETSSRRLGMATGRIVFLAFVVCSLMASLAGFYLAAQVQIGSPLIGNFGLESIAAAVLGGASLAGGQRIVRGRAARGALPLADRQRPAAVPPADGVLRRSPSAY